MLLAHNCRFQAANFCVVWRILKRFGKILVKETIFRQKNCVLIFRPKNYSKNIFSFLAFFNVSDRFSVFVHFGRFGRLAASFVQVLSKIVFDVEHFFFAAWS